MKKIIILYNTSYSMFSDLQNCSSNQVRLLDFYRCINKRNYLLRTIRKIWCERRVNDVINVPYKEIFTTLSKIDWNVDDEYLVVFMGIYNKAFSPAYLQHLQSRYKVNFAIFLIDSLSSPYASVSRYYIDNIQFKYIFTFDRADAEKHNYFYSDTLYSVRAKCLPSAIGYDLYYVGRNEPGRHTLLVGFCASMTKCGIPYMVRLYGVSQSDQCCNLGIIYNEFIDYDSIVMELQKSNCILELLREGQNGATSRYYEAVCYNKKLLTNNHNVVSLPFYDPRYMRVFDAVEDIDWDWVRERCPVDYHYDGRFSPNHFIERLMRMEGIGEESKLDEEETS